MEKATRGVVASMSQLFWGAAVAFLGAIDIMNKSIHFLPLAPGRVRGGSCCALGKMGFGEVIDEWPTVISDESNAYNRLVDSL
jgi:hypothetical protein